MKTTVSTVQKMKDNGEKITMLTAYDYSTAKLFDEAGIDTMLVGDSLGMVMLGYDSTIPVTVDDKNCWIRSNNKMAPFIYKGEMDGITPNGWGIIYEVDGKKLNIAKPCLS